LLRSMISGIKTWWCREVCNSWSVAFDRFGWGEAYPPDVGVHDDPSTSLERDGNQVLGEIREHSNREARSETIQQYSQEVPARPECVPEHYILQGGEELGHVAQSLLWCIVWLATWDSIVEW
jgi:hypothetical protein